VDTWKSVLDHPMAVVIGTTKTTPSVGVFAKEAMTLGAGGAMFGAGKTITFVAAAPSEPDRDKFIPVLERFAKYMLDTEFTGAEALQKKFKPQQKKPGHDLKGDFRVVAANDIVQTANRAIRHVAIQSAVFEAGSVTVQSKTKTLLTSRTGQVQVQAKSVVIGDRLQDGAEAKQNPTESILLQCKDSVAFNTTALRLHFDDKQGKVMVGKLMQANPGPGLDVDPTAPHLFIDTAAKVRVGVVDNAGPGPIKEFGFTVTQDGATVAVNAKTTLTLSAQDGAAITVGAADVSVAKKFKVGTALLVQGDGVFVKAPAIAMAQVLTRPPQLIALYNTTKGLATAQKLIITTCDATINGIRAAGAQRTMEDLQGLAYLYGADHDDELVHEQHVARRAAVIQLGTIQVTLQQIIDESRLYDMTDPQLGRDPAVDDPIFQVGPEPQ
jgi:hypothetical protein